MENALASLLTTRRMVLYIDLGPTRLCLQPVGMVVRTSAAQVPIHVPVMVWLWLRELAFRIRILNLFNSTLLVSTGLGA